MGYIQPTYKWDILGLEPIYQPLILHLLYNFLGHQSMIFVPIFLSQGAWHRWPPKSVLSFVSTIPGQKSRVNIQQLWPWGQMKRKPTQKVGDMCPCILKVISPFIFRTWKVVKQDYIIYIYIYIIYNSVNASSWYCSLQNKTLLNRENIFGHRWNRSHLEQTIFSLPSCLAEDQIYKATLYRQKWRFLHQWILGPNNWHSSQEFFPETHKKRDLVASHGSHIPPSRSAK